MMVLTWLWARAAVASSSATKVNAPTRSLYWVCQPFDLAVLSLIVVLVTQIYTFFTNRLTYINLFISYLFVQSFALFKIQIQSKNSIK